MTEDEDEEEETTEDCGTCEYRVDECICNRWVE